MESQQQAPYIDDPLTGKCFEMPLQMVSDSHHGSRGINIIPPFPPFGPFPPLDNDRGLPSSEFESAKSMNADFYRCLRAGQIDALKRMLKDEEDSLLDQVTPQQNTALHIVARQGLDQLIEPILSRRPGLLTQQNVDGDTALHIAAGAGHLATVESIMEFAGKADRGRLCEIGNRDKETALHVAVRNKHIRVARFLIESHPKASLCVSAKDDSPLLLAAELGDLELLRAMIQASDMDDLHRALVLGGSVVHAAIAGGNLGVLEAVLSIRRDLIDMEAYITDRGHMYPLSFASFKGNSEMVRYILTQFPECAYKINSGGLFPIHIAVAAGNKMVLEEFLSFHPDSRELLTSSGKNILHVASVQGRDDMVRYILRKPDLDELINARDKEGNTPLHDAVGTKHPKVVDALTWDKRVRLDIVNNYDLTAMDLAFKMENPLPSLKEQLTWLALKYAGAPRKNFLLSRRSNESEQATAETYKDRVNTLSVVATLVMTMSFAAGFTMPGGNNGSDPDLGMAAFLNRRIFQLFVISNSIALYTSVLDVLVLIFAMLGDVKLLQISLKLAVPLLSTSLATISIGFMSASYLVVSSLRWLGILIWVLGSVFLAVVLALFFLLFPPLSAKNRFTRYILYPPFRLMLYICERK